MPMFKCPACGRSNIDIPNVEPTDSEAGTLTMPLLETEVHCKNCGWFGTIAELKVGH